MSRDAVPGMDGGATRRGRLSGASRKRCLVVADDQAHRVGVAAGEPGALEVGVATDAGAGAVGPDVELVQRGGLEVRGGLVIERAEAFG